MVSTSQGQTIGSASLTSSGFVDYPSSGAHLLFQSSFEEPPYIAVSSSEYYLGNFAVATYISLGGGGTCWVEDSHAPTAGAPTPRTGRYCIGLSTPAAAGVLRSELEITHLDGTTGMGGIKGLALNTEAYCSVWLYLPSDWAITGASAEYWWYEMVNCYVLGGGGGYPRVCIHIHRPLTPTPHYNLQVEYNLGAGKDKLLVK